MCQSGWQFSKDWPDCCPPAEAKPAEGTVYAVAANNPFTPEDFTSAKTRNVLINGNSCERCGISVVSEILDARALLVRYSIKYKHIGVLNLTDSHGVLIENPRNDIQSHQTLWPFEQVQLHSEFTLVQK